jgi:hypothetical protein
MQRVDRHTPGQTAIAAVAVPRAAFVADTLSVLYVMRLWIFGLLAVIAAQSALAPSVAWITKEVLASITTIDRDVIFRLLIEWAPLYLAITGAGMILSSMDKVLDKLIDVRLLITLQRLYLDRRDAEADGKDASQVLFGARIANKGFDIIYKKSWKIVTMVVSVFVWQLSIGAEWLGLMALSVLAPSVFVFKLGPYVQKLSGDILAQHEDIASNTRRHRRGMFEAAQNAWMTSSLKFELLKWVTDEGASVLLWSSLIALVFASYLLGLGLVPAEIDIPTAAAFLVNLRLIAKPMMEISRTYSKWREAYPAMVAVFTGGDIPRKPAKGK